MTRLNKKERDYFYPLICQRDGEYCQLCQKTKDQVSILQIHELKYERPLRLDNMKLLCPSCNRISDLSKEKIDSVNATPEHKKNMVKEPYFRQWVLGKMYENNYHYELDEIIDSGSYIIGVSTETIKRYLKPLCSEEGCFSKPIAWADGNLHIFVKGHEPIYNSDNLKSSS